jgi:hypothetical protein
MGYAEAIPLDKCNRCDMCERIKPKVELHSIKSDGLDLIYLCDECFHG